MQEINSIFGGQAFIFYQRCPQFLESILADIVWHTIEWLNSADLGYFTPFTFTMGSPLGFSAFLAELNPNMNCIWRLNQYPPSIFVRLPCKAPV